MAKGKGRIYSLDMLRGFFVATIFFFDAPPDNMYPILMRGKASRLRNSVSRCSRLSWAYQWQYHCRGAILRLNNF